MLDESIGNLSTFISGSGMTQPDYAGTVALGYDDQWILGEIERHSSHLSEDNARF